MAKIVLISGAASSGTHHASNLLLHHHMISKPHSVDYNEPWGSMEQATEVLPKLLNDTHDIVLVCNHWTVFFLDYIRQLNNTCCIIETIRDIDDNAISIIEHNYLFIFNLGNKIASFYSQDHIDIRRICSYQQIVDIPLNKNISYFESIYAYLYFARLHAKQSRNFKLDYRDKTKFLNELEAIQKYLGIEIEPLNDTFNNPYNPFRYYPHFWITQCLDLFKPQIDYWKYLATELD